MEKGKKSTELSLRHLTNKKFGKIPLTSNQEVVNLAAPHIESFNFFLNEGMEAVLSDFPAVEFYLKEEERVSLSLSGVKVGKPEIPTSDSKVNQNIYPKECIERGATYNAPIFATVSCTYNGKLLPPVRHNLGNIPIMVKSKNCHLYGLSPKELVKRGELVNETGGYFIVNGSAKVLRMLTSNRCNYPLAISRPSWTKKLDGMTDKGVMVRCEKSDQTHVMNTLHYLKTGDAKLQFILKNQGFFIPLIMVMKALVDFSDHQMYIHLIRGREFDKYYKEKIKNMMLTLQHEGLYNREMCRKYIGSSFRQNLTDVMPPWFTDEEICEELFRNCILIHIESDAQKFDTFCLMARKLYAFVAGDAKAESPDMVSMQQATLGGHTYLQYTKELLREYLLSIKYMFLKNNKIKEGAFNITDNALKDAVVKGKKIGPALQYLIATGTLRSKTGCGLMQFTGLAVVVEHLNRMRDLSHLRSIHRGTFFLTMKSLLPRRLTGEAWGFICPVHTPDGAPCGLLNHLAQDCIIVSEMFKGFKGMMQVLTCLGMTGVDSQPVGPYEDCLEVVLNGILVGWVQNRDVDNLAQNLRLLKTRGKIFKFTEIIYIKKRKFGGQYPAIFLATNLGRLMRPVINLSTKTVEYVGTLEQIYLNIAVSPEDIEEGVHTHMEINKATILSNIGKLVPFSDCNPIPRNMYQCQMGKQTMGTPFHNWRAQTTSKSYRLQYPQVALVRNSHYDDINMEEFCMGFNAVVAICSYTGYDMEDAMVVNKCAMERGLAHGQIFKSEFIDLTEARSASKDPSVFFRRKQDHPDIDKFLDSYGLPYPGTKLTDGDPYYCTYNIQTHEYRVVSYKGEDCVVDKYSIMGSSFGKYDFQRVNITIRVARNPTIGDKFASRAGQKGIMSRLYPMEDLPFSERGITPDIMFNPHGMPSRMTAGVLLELVGGKSAAEFGKSFDSTPFQFSDEDPAVDYFGKMLEKGGFNYCGEDTLYSGTDGRMLEAKIFMGIIYYQRLRHMTADKWQVRQTGAVDLITRQPIKGRKRGGAIRFGEMERDCLISHGASYTLQDRLLYCSDATQVWVCEQCQESLSPIIKFEEGNFHVRSKLPVCSMCGPSSTVRKLFFVWHGSCCDS